LVQQTANGRIATLDGVRAISICLVLCAHAFGTGILPMTPAAHIFADVGVRSFFVLSGFLITTLLLRERARHGQISLRGFYLRRSLRIFPAFYTYLGVVLVLRAAGVVTASNADLGFAATYTMNFHAERAWSVGHLWSLAVEEQFYLLWPLALVLLGTRRALPVATAAILAAPVIRIAVWYGWPELRALTDQAFPCVFDTLATGCVLAIGRNWLEAAPRYRRLLDARWFWAVPAIGIASLVVTRPWIGLGASMTLANLGIALIIHRCVSRPTDAVGTVLEHPILVRIGTLSYSLYLWQQLFLNRHSSSWINAFPVNVVFACVAAALSYRFIERPFLRLSERLRKRGAGHAPQPAPRDPPAVEPLLVDQQQRAWKQP
jgi:peptidoglycan/LPS O-acetylase OafA/YrhL